MRTQGFCLQDLDLLDRCHEPASAAALAGAKKLVARGIIRRDEHVVALLTGHLLKDSQTGMPQSLGTQVIEPTLAAVKQALAM